MHSKTAVVIANCFVLKVLHSNKKCTILALIRIAIRLLSSKHYYFPDGQQLTFLDFSQFLYCLKHQLKPTTCKLICIFFSDLSKNRFSELPEEVTDFHFLERLQCYHNAIRLIPDSISSLQCLNFLDLSRNQLTALPREICLLPIQVKIFKFKIINLNKITTIIIKLFYEYCLMTAPVFYFKRYSTEVCCTFINIKILLSRPQ